MDDSHVPIKGFPSVQDVLRERLTQVCIHFVDSLTHRLTGLSYFFHVIDDHVELFAGNGQHDIGRAMFQQVLVVRQVLSQFLHVGHGVLRTFDEIFHSLKENHKSKTVRRPLRDKQIRNEIMANESSAENGRLYETYTIVFRKTYQLMIILRML